MNRPGSDLRGLLLAVYLALAPSSVPQWRADLRFRPFAVLSVGDTTPSIASRGPDGDRRLEFGE